VFDHDGCPNTDEAGVWRCSSGEHRHGWCIGIGRRGLSSDASASEGPSIEEDEGMPALSPRAWTRRLGVLATAIVLAACGITPVAVIAPRQAPHAATTTAAAQAANREPGAATGVSTADPAVDPDPIAVPLVPVTGFWSTATTIARTTLVANLKGGTRAVYVSAADLAPLVTALGITPGANVHALTPAAVIAKIVASPGSLGLVRPEDVRPTVRALAVNGVRLFGDGRIRDLAGWPLLVQESADAFPSTFDPATTWTLVAGGDVMLDRAVYKRTVIDGLGANYPWAGGNAKITSTYCCGYPGWRISKASASAGGTFRAYLRRQDLAIANLEGPAPSNFVYHPTGFIFSMDPKLLAGVKSAGIDMVSLANNHIRNFGSAGIASTIRNLNAYGILHAGAGANSKAARQPAWLTAGGLRIAVLAYNGIGGAPNATSTSAGAAALTLANATADIKAARAAGADVVIVFPHWGVEYTDRLNSQQASLGPALLKAGADAVIGGHSHWAGPIRVVGSKLIVYSMGDFVFELLHDTRTQEGILVELTFTGKHLSQVVLRPTFIVSAVQPGFLLPGYGGSSLMSRIHAASKLAGMP
jgi:poly-gamma-glutamate synthesis protein (capsule biosynthesis protein)